MTVFLEDEGLGMVLTMGVVDTLGFSKMVTTGRGLAILISLLLLLMCTRGAILGLFKLMAASTTVITDFTGGYLSTYCIHPAKSRDRTEVRQVGRYDYERSILTSCSIAMAILSTSEKAPSKEKTASQMTKLSDMGNSLPKRMRTQRLSVSIHNSVSTYNR